MSITTTKTTTQVMAERKIRIGLYGGSFNPIHLGHLETAMRLLDAKNGVDEIRFLLNPCSPFKRKNNMPDAYHRAKMIVNSIKDEEYYKYADRWDLDATEMLSSVYNHVCYTVNTLKEILYNDVVNRENNEYFLIMGIDVFNDIRKFRDWKWFLEEKLVKFIILPRGGYTINEELKDEFKDLIHNVDLTDFTPITMSSTDIRTAIQNGDDKAMESMLPKGAYSYIRCKKLYDYPGEAVCEITKTPIVEEKSEIPTGMPTVEVCKDMLRRCPYTIISDIKHGLAIVRTTSQGKYIYNVYNFLTSDTVIDEWFMSFDDLHTLGDVKPVKGTKFQYDYKQYNTGMFLPTDVKCYTIVANKELVRHNTSGNSYNTRNILIFNSFESYKMFELNCYEQQGNYIHPQYIVRADESGIKGTVILKTINGTEREVNLYKDCKQKYLIKK